MLSAAGPVPGSGSRARLPVRSPPLGIARVRRGRSTARAQPAPPCHPHRLAALASRRMPIDRAFSRRAGFQAYLIAAFSLVYAVVFLGFVRNHPENTQAAALAWALIAGAGLSATIATTSAAARVGGDARWWLAALGGGCVLLSGVHGT